VVPDGAGLGLDEAVDAEGVGDAVLGLAVGVGLEVGVVLAVGVLLAVGVALGEGEALGDEESLGLKVTAPLAADCVRKAAVRTVDVVGGEPQVALALAAGARTTTAATSSTAAPKDARAMAAPSATGLRSSALTYILASVSVSDRPGAPHHCSPHYPRFAEPLCASLVRYQSFMIA